VTEDTFAGLCPNVTAGRVANFLDLHGPSYVVDAACASSLAAVDCAIDSLRNGDVDLAVCGGVHAHMGLSLFIGFSKFHGLSPGRLSPFDEAADGFLLGEGAGCFVLKRLDDALRDDDQVFAVIRGIGSSSDGREKGIGAPTPRAQALAIRRAFDEAGYSPATVQLIEAHGAGTAVGDPVELEATHEVFGPQLSPGQRVVVTAVKSHGSPWGGRRAGLEDRAGLHHEVMAPTIHHTRPNRDPVDTPRSRSTARARGHRSDGLPRR
jgi:acyl transferase domain-containing protein